MLNPLNFISKFIKSSNQRELERIEKIVKEWENGISPPTGLMLNVGNKPISTEIFQTIKISITKKCKLKT